MSTVSDNVKELSGAIRKNDNDFSFLKTICSLVGNSEFGNGNIRTQMSMSDSTLSAETAASNIWTMLSAIGEDIGGEFNEKLINYIDNITNIELCKVHSLESICQLLGINYSVFNTIRQFPREIIDLIDVLSIKREYLLDYFKVNHDLADFVSISATVSDDSTTNIISNLNTLRSQYLVDSPTLSNDWSSNNLTTNSYIVDDKVNEIVNAIYLNILSAKVDATYKDVNGTLIRDALKNEIALSGFAIPNPIATTVNRYKISHNINPGFNVEIEVDRIENNETTLSSYSQNEQYILEKEISRRQDPFDSAQLQTRCKYYHEKEVQTYFKFITDQYCHLNGLYNNSTQYDADVQYIKLEDTSDVANRYNVKCILSTEANGLPYVDSENHTIVKTEWIEQIAKLLTNITTLIRNSRETLKSQCQRNFMKGTFLLVSYLINEYLNTNVYQNIKELCSSIGTQDQYVNKAEIVEYVDPTNYFNISTDIDGINADVNPRYWEHDSSIDAIGAIDNTNIFTILPKLKTSTMAFNLQTIENFYRKILQNKFVELSNEVGIHTTAQVLDGDNLSVEAYLSAPNTTPVSSFVAVRDYKQQCHLIDFLSIVFDIGADRTYINSATNTLCIDNNIAVSSEMYANKEEMYWKYSGNISADQAYYNLENSIHPSYQIHPYLSAFIEYYDYSYPIENIANIVRDNIESTISAEGLSNCVDRDGYLINLWRNPLNSNSEYISRYEAVDHTDVNNNQNKYYGYDGLFHADALSSYLNATNSNYESIMSAHYYGLNLPTEEWKYILKQMEFWKDSISAVVNSNHYFVDIYRYGIDIYGTMYILVKDYNAESISDLINVDIDTKRNTTGTLWIKRKNHPLAFPAFAVKPDNTLDNDVSQIYSIDNDSTNQDIFCDDVKLNAYIGDNVSRYKYPEIYDFSLSKDKTEIVLDVAANIDSVDVHWPLVAFPDIIFDKKLSRDALVLNKNQTDVGLLELRDLQKHGEYRELSEYTFGTFFNDKYILGVIYWKLESGNTLKLLWFEYDKSRSESHIKPTSPTIIQLNSAPIDNRIVIDAYQSGDQNLTTFSISYLANADLKPTCESYAFNPTSDNDLDAHREFNTSILSDISTVDVPTLNRDITKKIVNIQKILFGTELVDAIDVHQQEFMQFVDSGFNPLFEGKNDFHHTELPTYLEHAGTAKFEILGKTKPLTSAMDFVQVVPVRMFESAASSLTDVDDISALDLMSIHFDENGDIDTAHALSAANSIYDPTIFSTKYQDQDLTYRVDESYVKILSENGYSDMIDPYSPKSINDSLVDAPYLWFTTENRDIPDRLVYANISAANIRGGFEGDYLVFSLFTNYNISASAAPTDDGYQLDFNTAYYLSASEPAFDGTVHKNIFNRKHLFLSLRHPGDAGHLQFWNDTFDTVQATYFIKNISTKDHARFMLSVHNDYLYVEDPWKENTYLVTGAQTVDKTGYNVGNEYIMVTKDNIQYQLKIITK